MDFRRVAPPSILPHLAEQLAAEAPVGRAMRDMAAILKLARRVGPAERPRDVALTLATAVSRPIGPALHWIAAYPDAVAALHGNASATADPAVACALLDAMVQVAAPFAIQQAANGLWRWPAWQDPAVRRLARALFAEVVARDQEEIRSRIVLARAASGDAGGEPFDQRLAVFRFVVGNWPFRADSNVTSRFQTLRR